MKYAIIYTDPPWPINKGGIRKARPNQTRLLDYGTLSLDDIKNVHTKICTEQAEDYHNIFMWTVDKFLHEAEAMMNAVGYKLHARMIWDKGNGIAPAFTVRFSHEYLLWFYRPGFMLKPHADTVGKFTTVFTEKSTAHSKKPECAYSMIENMFPAAKKLELFARAERKGWDALGNDIGTGDIREVPA